MPAQTEVFALEKYKADRLQKKLCSVFYGKLSNAYLTNFDH